MPSKCAWLKRPSCILKEEVECKHLKWGFKICLIKSRECLVRANICYWSKLRHDNMQGTLTKVGNLSTIDLLVLTSFSQLFWYWYEGLSDIFISVLTVQKVKCLIYTHNFTLRFCFACLLFVGLSLYLKMHWKCKVRVLWVFRGQGKLLNCKTHCRNAQQNRKCKWTFIWNHSEVWQRQKFR